VLIRVAEILAVLTHLSTSVENSSTQISELKEITAKTDTLISDVRTITSERSVESQTSTSTLLEVSSSRFTVLNETNYLNFKSLELVKNEIFAIRQSTSASATTEKVLVALEELKSTVITTMQLNDSKVTETLSTSNESLITSLKELQKVSQG
jgi:hypothetical protein